MSTKKRHTELAKATGSRTPSLASRDDCHHEIELLYTFYPWKIWQLDHMCSFLELTCDASTCCQFSGELGRSMQPGMQPRETPCGVAVYASGWRGGKLVAFSVLQNYSTISQSPHENRMSSVCWEIRVFICKHLWPFYQKISVSFWQSKPRNLGDQVHDTSLRSKGIVWTTADTLSHELCSINYLTNWSSLNSYFQRSGTLLLASRDDCHHEVELSDTFYQWRFWQLLRACLLYIISCFKEWFDIYSICK